MPVIPMRREELVDQRASRVNGVSRGVLMAVDPPKAKGSWHPTAKRLYASFAESGQVHWWQQSDWALAYSLMEDLSAWKRQEELAVKSRQVRDGWDASAAHLTPAERTAQGFARERPGVTSYASPQKMAVIYQMLGTLLVTEADRRKAHIELEAPVSDEVSASEHVLADYRRRLASA